MENISENVTYMEATKSTTAMRLGIDNTPTDAILKVMSMTSRMLYEPIREQFGPIFISSFYRSVELNKAIGGSKTSQHCKGEAIDLDRDVFGLPDHWGLYNWIKANLTYDQLIFEYGWIHVSYREGNNRMMDFSIR